MKPLHIVATCLRLLAVVWLLYALSHLNSVLSYAHAQSHDPANASAVWITTLLQLVACAVLWFYPMTIASKLLPGGASVDSHSSPPQLVEWQTLGVICVGLWGLLHVVPLLAYWAAYAMLYHERYSAEGLELEDQARIAAHVVELLFSLWLVFGAKGVAALLFRIRTAGTRKD